MRIKDSPILYASLSLLNGATYELAQAVGSDTTQITEEQAKRLEDLLQEIGDKLGRFTRNLQLINGFVE